MLESWKDTPARQAIVELATREGGDELVPVSERVAVFDNDGWGTVFADACA